MDARRGSELTPMKNRTTVERKSERELVVTRTVNGPARIVFEAWTKPELFKQWWAPKSMGMFLRSCEMDVRVDRELGQNLRSRSQLLISPLIGMWALPTIALHRFF